MSHNETPQLKSGNGQVSLPDPEVVPKAERRRFSAEYKQHILQEAEACTRPGEVGALLRREGLYSSHLTTWRQQRRRGELQGLAPPHGRADCRLSRPAHENQGLKLNRRLGSLTSVVFADARSGETPSDEST
jgi:transposase-like protein